MNLQWKKKIFSSVYQLFEGEEKKGEIEEGIFKKVANGHLNHSRLSFKKEGYFSSTIDIIDQDHGETLGSIKFGSWGTKADIQLGQATYQWKYDNFLSSRWSISQNGKALINYKSGFKSGEINSEGGHFDDVLVLSGLNVHNHFLQVFIIILFMVIIISNN